MNIKTSAPTMGFAAALLLAAIAPPAVAATDQFTLARAAPGDVFVFVNGRHNPEAAFIEEYWGEVLQALKESGIGDDFLSLISSLLGEEDRAELDRFVAKANDLIGAVDWDALTGGEVAFFERLPQPTTAPGSISMAPPDIIVMFRHANDKAPANYDALVAMVDTFVQEIGQATETRMPAFERGEKDGVRIASLPIVQLDPTGPPYGLRIALRGDTVIIAIGDKMLGEVLDLLDGKNADQSLAANERFKAAFAKLPAAENEMFFLDMQTLLNPIRSLASAVVREKEKGGQSGQSKIKNTGMSEEANRLIGKSVAAYQAGNIDEALKLITQAHEAEPRDTIVLYNLACFNALAGNKDDALNWLEKAVDGGFHDPGKISSDTDLKSLREDPRFAAALKKAEEGVASDTDSEVTAVGKIIDRIIDIPGLIDCIASVTYTEGYSVSSETIVTMTADAPKNPFYPVIANRKPIEKFDRYVPEEATGFSISSGIDFDALYSFIEDTIRMAGPDGEDVLAQWEKVQQDSGFNFRKDVLGWIDGEVVAVTMPGMQNGVFMVKVKDETVAREKIKAGMNALSELIAKAAEQNPMLAMYTIRTAPLNNANLEGFERLYVGMNAMVWGVADSQLIIGLSDKDIEKCLGVAKGEHAGVRSNTQIMAEALVPDGPFASVSYTDYRNLGQVLAGLLGLGSMAMGGMSMAIPEPDARSALVKVAGMLGKLTPVVGKIDFYKSTATLTTFEGNAWRAKTVTHYVASEERKKPEPATE